MLQGLDKLSDRVSTSEVEFKHILRRNILKIKLNLFYFIRTIATGLLFYVNWKTLLEKEFPLKIMLGVFACRVLGQILSQLYFGYRCWCLIGRKRWVAVCWIGILFCEFTFASVSIFVVNQDWTMDNSRPRKCELQKEQARLSKIESEQDEK